MQWHRFIGVTGTDEHWFEIILVVGGFHYTEVEAVEEDRDGFSG